MQKDPRDNRRIDVTDHVVSQASLGIRDAMNLALEPHGLKVLEWRILRSLDPERPRTICDLSERVLSERSFTGRTVDRLAERGLVTKNMSARDRRFVQVTLSAAGATILRRAEDDLRDLQENLFRDIDSDQVDALLEILGRLGANATGLLRNASDESAPKPVAAPALMSGRK